MRRVSGSPACTAPSLVFERTSERLSFSSTKYGPTVLAGVMMHVADAASAHVGAERVERAASGAATDTGEQQREASGAGRADGHPAGHPVVVVRSGDVSAVETARVMIAHAGQDRRRG